MKRPSKRSIFIITGIVSVLLTTGIVLFLLTRPSFTLKSDAPSVIEAGSEFDPLDFVDTVKFAKHEDIKIINTVDLSVTGEYSVTFSLGWQSETVRVTVEDTQAPMIYYSGEHYYNVPLGAASAGEAEDVIKAFDMEILDATIIKGDEYTAEFDTSPVDLNKAGYYTAILSVKDLSGNETRMNITVRVVAPDLTPPVISGARDTTIRIGDAFSAEADVTVKDDQDDSPTLTIDASALNVSKAGTYTVIYTATDKAGNTATVRRKITVKNSKMIYRTDGGATWDASGIDGQPYLVAVNRLKNTLTVYQKDASGNYTVPVKAILCSVGRSGHETPTGQWNTLERYRWCYMVDGSYAQYAIRIKGGIMFHSVPYFTQNAGNLEYEEYNKLGQPASLGCIRMSAEDIKWLYDNCPAGFPAVVYDDSDSAGPLGRPAAAQRIDINDAERRGWDPTDPDPKNPWKAS